MQMKRNPVLAVIAMLHALLFAIPIFALVGGLSRLEGTLLLRFVAIALLLFLPVLLSFLLLRLFRNLFLYLGTAVLITAGMGMAGYRLGGFFPYGDVITALLLGVLSAVIFLIGAWQRIVFGQMKKDFLENFGLISEFHMQEWEVRTIINTPLWLHLIFHAVLYFLVTALKLHDPIRIIFYTALADVFLIAVFTYLQRFYTYVRENQEIAGLPVGTMTRIHRVIGAIALILLILVTLPSIFYGREMLEYVTLPERQPVEREALKPEETAHDEQMMMNPDMSELIGDTEPFVWPAWLVALGNILVYATVIAILLAIIYSIYKAARAAGVSFAVESQDEVLFLNQDSSDKVSRSRGFDSLRGLFGPNAKIRRTYRKQIQKNTKGAVRKSSTPVELERDAGFTGTSEQILLHTLYEKARYSKDGCTAEEAASISR